jgi:hypothetical protein
MSFAAEVSAALVLLVHAGRDCGAGIGQQWGTQLFGALTIVMAALHQRHACRLVDIVSTAMSPS